MPSRGQEYSALAVRWSFGRIMGTMTTKKSGLAWVLAVAIASALVLRPSEARADDTAEAVPFMVMAAVFTVTIIVIAINNPTDDDSETPAAATSTSEEQMRYSPLREGPKRRAAVLGFTTRF